MRKKVDCFYFSKYRNKSHSYTCLENKLPCVIQAFKNFVQGWSNFSNEFKASKVLTQSGKFDEK